MARFIIDDSNCDFHMDRKDPRCGTLPPKHKYGSLSFAPVTRLKPIPMAQWPDLIADANRKRAFARHVWEDSPIGVLMQGQICYCHGFSAVEAVMIQRMAQGEPYIELSPSSVAAPITGYKNAGAVIEDDLRQMVDVGVSSTAYVPTLTTNAADFKPGWRDDAARNKVSSFEEISPRDFVMHGTALLLGWPVCVGLNYWGHAVCDFALVDLNPRLNASDPNRYGIDFLNSWDESWGDKGTGIRTGSKAPADSAYIPLQVRPSIRS